MLVRDSCLTGFATICQDLPFSCEKRRESLYNRCLKGMCCLAVSLSHTSTTPQIYNVAFQLCLDMQYKNELQMVNSVCMLQLGHHSNHDV